MNRIALAYSGVHQIFQLALAAQEMGELDALMCAISSTKGSWGSRLKSWIPDATARPLGSSDISNERIFEHPWPLLASRITRRLLPRRRTDHIITNDWFDRAAEKWLRGRNASIFVGVETCCLRTLKQARSMGMRRVLDCAGIPVQTLDAEANRAAEAFGLQIKPSSNSPRMRARKREEIAEADLVLCCSEFQRSKLVENNPSIRQSEVVPLWADIGFWKQAAAQRKFSEAREPLRLLYVGAISLRKGVPYLLEAVENLREKVTLTLVGSVSDEIKELLPRYGNHRYIPHVDKSRLRELYSQHDLFVMPSLGDSFGFVIMEAMAAGMPCIASSNAGSPLPCESWRFPAHDCNAIRELILKYADDRELLEEHGIQAQDFASNFLPEQYRIRIKQIFGSLLR